MGNIRWDITKNEWLKIERGVSFEEVMACIENEQVLAIIENPSHKYERQRVFVVSIKNYIYYVPFVEDNEGVFLKTIIPSRKLRKQYNEGE